MGERLCVIRDGHFLWWKPSALKCSDAAQGCLNLFVHKAEVAFDEAHPTVFTIRPSEPNGWNRASSFGGGQDRAFVFDTAHCPVSRDEWVAAIQQHIDFCKLAREQMGEQAVLEQIGVYKPTFRQLEPCVHGWGHHAAGGS